MSNNETQADISREMRTYFQAKKRGNPEHRPWHQVLSDWADRIEAAAERERIQRDKVSFRCGDCARFGGDCDAGDSDGNDDCVACEKFVRRAPVPGNAAAMRRVLLNAKARFASLALTNSEWRICAEEHVREIAAALSAPPRNCDRYRTAEEARLAFWDTHEAIWDEFKNRGGTELFYEVIDWLFAKAEGGAE